MMSLIMQGKPIFSRWAQPGWTAGLALDLLLPSDTLQPRPWPWPRP